MKHLLTLLSLLTVVSWGEAFTKYGRSCKDIGCPGTQVCVMETDPCSYRGQGECGAYPTCKRKSSLASRTCSTFVCPPSQVCRMDGDTPKCVNDASKSGHVGYDTHAANAPLDPSAPAAETGGGGGQVYPQVPRGETTPRPYARPASGGGGYTGQIGSGYPGYSGYPQQSGGYPQQNGGYPQYPQQNGGYPQYPQQNGGYSQGGYNPQGGYPQGGYNQQYPQKSASPSITDKITDSLKTIGTNFLKDYLSKALGGRN